MSEELAMRRTDKKYDFKKIINRPGFGLGLVFCSMFIVLSFASEYFLTVQNILIILNQSSFITVMAIGMTLVIGMGGIDLSVGSVLSLCGIVAGNLLLSGMPVFIAVIIALLAGLFVGIINGIIVAKAKITDFIVTLAMMTLIKGVLRVYTGGMPVFGLKMDSFTWIGQGKVFGISSPFIISVIVLAIFYFITYKTAFGRYVVSIGSNSDAAKLVGINIDKTKIMVYGLCGMLAAVASVLIASRVSTAMPDAGEGYELNVIAATVIGGTSLSGGKARIFGAMIGSVMMTMVSNGLNILNVDTAWHQVVIGLIILLAVGLDEFSNRRASLN